ncbi:hypothetical protein LTR84_010954 [Exophiala bonariae]|uniref:Major facilitator superfamily (MFS) profile domain-containing protein n=1 Tax=Exophiala bonariae TaxID=1690606 RepID=A0AAV9NHT9_9EURO|nr:hypothetical protein LTR84_010954 [Exophiala bonariae]
MDFKTESKAASDHIDVLKEVPVEAMEEISEEYRAIEKRLVRKLDYTLVPMLWVLYLFNYLDRNNIAQARLNSFEDDLNLKGNQFNIAVSVLNVGYMLMQLPSNMLLTRTRPSLYIPVWAALWSIISASTAATHSFRQLIAVRFLLGVAEAPFFPGAMYLLSCYYTRKELAVRTALLYSGVILATAFSGLLAAGIFSGLDGVHSMAGWQWLFILEGSGSFLVSLVAMFILPDFPGANTGSAKWLLTEEERRISVNRISRDRVSEKTIDGSVWSGLAAAVKDIKTWIFVIMLTGNHSAYGFNNFFPTIVKGFDLGNNTITLILTAPPYLLASVVAFAVALSSDRRKERGWHMSAPMVFSCIGFIISVATLNKAARYTAAFLYICGCFSSNALVFSWAANTLSQSPEKRACATAIINLLSQLGNIWSPYFFPKSDGPRYVMAMLLMMASTVISMLSAMLMKFLLVRANRKLKADGAEQLFTL